MSAAATLRIDLTALSDNYRLLADKAAGAVCAAAVKADGYGLGLEWIAPTLWESGCRVFFVAHAAEGAGLRAILPDATIHVLHGLASGGPATLLRHGLTPVLNSLDEIDRWRRDGRGRPAAIHVDTGMNRLGLDDADADRLIQQPQRAAFPISLLMSHLACADTPAHPMNRLQCERFAAYGEGLRQAAGRPDLPLSLANSAGVLLGADYHFNMVRPGIALYGGNPIIGSENPMRPVITLDGNILQCRDLPPGAIVGYGAAFRAERPSRIATVDVGYADGFLRACGDGRLCADVAGHRAPIVGRISMDMLALDVTGLPEAVTQPGRPVTLLGGPVSLDDVSAVTGLSAYELLTLLGRRYNRVCIGEVQGTGSKVLISK